MNRMRASCFALAIFSLAGNYQPTEPVPLTNDDVMLLVGADVFDDVAIISVIYAARWVQFDLDTGALNRLRQSGVSSDVIAAMAIVQTGAVGAPTPTTPNVAPVPNFPEAGADPNSSAWSDLPHGIHLVNPDGSTTQIVSTAFAVVARGPTNHWAPGLTVRTPRIASVPGPRANYRIREQRPSFLFINSGGASDLSPNNWVLVQFLEKQDSREIHISEVLRWFDGSGRITGLDTRQVVMTNSEVIDDGNYKVSTGEDLGEGEFGFVPIVTDGPGGTLYDFGVDIR